jgi:DNA-binding response OmpR family regulator
MIGTQSSLRVDSGAPCVVRKRILLVDDHRAKEDSPALLLCQSGYAVDWAKSVAEARSRWWPHLYDLVVINLAVDRFDSALLCHELKDQQSRQVVATISGEPVSVPASFLPDAVIRPQNRQQFLATIKFLLAHL